MSRLWARRCLVWVCMRTSSVQAQFAGAILYECSKQLPQHDVLGSSLWHYSDSAFRGGNGGASCAERPSFRFAMAILAGRKENLDRCRRLAVSGPLFISVGEGCGYGKETHQGGQTTAAD